MVEGADWSGEEVTRVGRVGGGGVVEKLGRKEDSIHFVNNSNKLYLHDYNRPLQYCKSYTKLIIDSFKFRYLKKFKDINHCLFLAISRISSSISSYPSFRQICRRKILKTE